MKESELISIILPVYNGEKYLAISVESCLNQTYQNIELIIVNDCSTDATLTIINHYTALDSRIRVINNIENKKLPRSLNIGHEAANGDFITWTSDDNYYELNALEVLLKTLKLNEVDVVYSNIRLVNSDGDFRRFVFFLPFENIIFGNFIGSCFLYSKDVFERNNGYKEDLFLVEDYDFWLRAALHSRFYLLKEILYSYRIHNNSLTNAISTDKIKKNVYEANLKKMYSNFSKIILSENNEVISTLQTKILTHQKISFNWIKEHNFIIEKFKNNLIQNQNFNNRNQLDKVFMNKIVQIMTLEKNFFSKSLFIVYKYYKSLDKNSIKTLIKYSFFK
jgi:glycosyltransferase involved in cell wall biosynthesis